MKTFSFSPLAFDRFESSVNYWMNRLGLTEWNYSVEHTQLSDGVSACVDYNNKSKNARFSLTAFCSGDFAFEADVQALALHEVLHLMLSDFCWVSAQAKDDFADVVISHEHELINRLLKVIPQPPVATP